MGDDLGAWLRETTGRFSQRASGIRVEAKPILTRQLGVQHLTNQPMGKPPATFGTIHQSPARSVGQEILDHGRRLPCYDPEHRGVEFLSQHRRCAKETLPDLVQPPQASRNHVPDAAWKLAGRATRFGQQACQLADVQRVALRSQLDGAGDGCVRSNAKRVAG
jgi:hypothetical protein